jgi:hypothetical protein
MEYVAASPKSHSLLKRLSIAGYTLIEANAATAMVGIFVSGVMVMNSNLLNVLKSSKESAAANQALQERVEQMRIANWVQITDSNYVAQQILNTATSSAVGLPALVETMTVSPYTALTGTTAPVKVSRAGSTASIQCSNPQLQNERMVRVDINLVWESGQDKRQRVRATSVLIAKGGITK